MRKFFAYVQLWAFDYDGFDVRFYYSNLEDKVLIGDGGIFMNESVPVLAKQPNNRLNDCVWDPS